MDQPQELIQLSDSDSDDSDSSDSDSGSDSDSDSDSDDSAQSTTSYEEVVESKAGIDQALRFFNSVKDAFGGNSEVFAKFKQLLKDYRNDINVVQSKIKLLFKDHPEFVAGFNTFLPAGFDISMPVQTDHSVSFAVDIEEAIRFVNKVKVEYMHDERRYASFLNILKGHASKEKSIVEVFEEVVSY